MTEIFLSFFSVSLSAGLAVAVLMLFAPYFGRRYAAKWKYLIWIFLALRLLVPLNGANMQPLTKLLSQGDDLSAVKRQEAAADASDDKPQPTGRILVEIPAQLTTPIAAQPDQSNAGITPLDLAAFVWAAGGMVFLSVHLISYFCLKRLVQKKGKRPGNARITRQLSVLKRELRVGRAVRVVEYCGADSPMILGFFHPVLVLPEETYSEGELFFILKHELVHLKRRDVYGKLLFVMANAVHWFNPLVWILRKEAAVDMELSCDERVTQGADDAVRRAYTETLLSMLQKQCARRCALSTQFYGGKDIMKKRFQNILINRKKKNGIAVLMAAMLLTGALGTLIGCSVTKESEAEDGRTPEALATKAREQIPETPETQAGEGTPEALAADPGNEGTAAEPTGAGDEGAADVLGDGDCLEITAMIEAFSAAYFDGDVEGMREFLADTYEGEPETYESAGAVSDLTVKGLSASDEKKIEDERCVASLEFRDSTYEDMFLYLTFEFVRQEDGWKIEFYGVEV